MGDLQWPDPERREAALERLLARVQAGNPRDRRADLSAAEAEVLQAMAAGLDRSAAADVLGVSLETIKTRLLRARRVLGAKTLPQAVAIAMRQGQVR